ARLGLLADRDRGLRERAAARGAVGAAVVVREGRSDLLRLRLGVAAVRDGLSGDLLGAGLVARAAAWDGALAGHRAFALAHVPDHVRRGADQDPRRQLLERSDLPV